VLSLPPAFVLSQDQTLRLNQKSSIRLYLVTLKADTHRCASLDREPILSSPKAKKISVSKRVRRKTLASPTTPKGRPQDVRRPRFSFFHIRLSKSGEQSSQPKPEDHKTLGPRKGPLSFISLAR
jgi:hypothetical protein